jgi:hypothetical protein
MLFAGLGVVLKALKNRRELLGMKKEEKVARRNEQRLSRVPRRNEGTGVIV